KVAEKSTSALNFNGTSQYIQYSNTVIPIGEKTIKFKIKTSSNSYSHIFSNSGASSTTSGLLIMLNVVGEIECQLRLGGSTFAWKQLRSNKISDNKWHDVMVT